MNCKPMDLAVVLRSACGNEGRIVRCIKFEQARFISGPLSLRGVVGAWLLEEPLPSPIMPCTHVPDDYLRPIRDNDGEDETLQWAGKPQSAREVA